MFSTSYIILCFFNIILSIESLEVKTTLGPIKGKLNDDITTGAYYYSFEGIPYAEPPVGKLRFKPPVQKRAWKTVHDATKPGWVCPQKELFYSKKQMSEDCLHFNIYTPANYQNKSLPVMFYVHDGNFKLQSGNAEPIYGPQIFMLHKVVVVTMNYRLGALGFLSLCNEEVSGNAGVKDVLLLLKIIKKNISKFGGNPNKITIMGIGAGAAIVQFLMLSDKCKGLFQNAILISASVLSPEFIQLHPRRNAILLALKLGIGITNDDSMVKELRHANVHDIVEAQEAIADKDLQRGFRIWSPFKPTVEIPSNDAIITRPPLQLLKEGSILDIPLFMGFNNQEGLEIFPVLKKEPELIDTLNEHFELCIPADIEYPYGSLARKNLAARIKEFYFKGENISFLNIQNYIHLLSDSKYTFSIDFFIKLFTNRKSSPVYYYDLAIDGQLNWFKKFANITFPGTAHNDDIGYAFLTSVTKSTYHHLDSASKAIQTAVMMDLRTFMVTGAPAPNPMVSCWPEAGKNRHHLLLGCAPIPIFERPIPDRIDFWANVYDEYFGSNSTSIYASYFCPMLN